MLETKGHPDFERYNESKELPVEQFRLLPLTDLEIITLYFFLHDNHEDVLDNIFNKIVELYNKIYSETIGNPVEYSNPDLRSNEYKEELKKTHQFFLDRQIQHQRKKNNGQI